MTTVIAVGAAFFGWRARQLEPQRRAVARIVELGGFVDVERRGWLEAIWRGCDTEEVIGVTIQGQVAEDAAPALAELSALERVTLTYETVLWSPFRVGPETKHYLESRKGREHAIPTQAFDERHDQLRRWLPRVELVVSEQMVGN
jgi:hypothetical protein